MNKIINEKEIIKILKKHLDAKNVELFELIHGEKHRIVACGQTFEIVAEITPKQNLK